MNDKYYFNIPALIADILVDKANFVRTQDELIYRRAVKDTLDFLDTIEIINDLDKEN